MAPTTRSEAEKENEEMLTALTAFGVTEETVTVLKENGFTSMASLELLAGEPRVLSDIKVSIEFI